MNMSTAILSALFRNLMYHQAGDAIVQNSATPTLEKLARRPHPGGRAPAVGERLLAVTDELVKRYRDQMQRALLLTVKWNQPTFARRILLDLPPTHDHTRPMRKMLQHALELQRVEIVKLLLERPGTTIASVNLCSLYLLEDPYNFLRSDLPLQARLHLRLSEIARDGSSASYFGQARIQPVNPDPEHTKS